MGAIKADVVGMLHVFGNLRLEGLDRLAQLKTPLSLPALKVITDIKTNSLFTGFGKMEIGLLFYEIISEIQLNMRHYLPIKANAMINVPEKKLEINVEPIPETKTVLKVKVTPMTSLKRIFVNNFTPTNLGYEY